jgi:lambda repressor-like predicted transcriptional regulator
LVALISDLIRNKFGAGALHPPKGVDVDYIAERVAQLLSMDVQEVWQPGKYRCLATTHSLLCFWAVRELGESMASLARRLGISTVTVSKSVDRGAQIIQENAYVLI